MSAKILVTGGCGYIGSHTLLDLMEQGFDVLCLDSNIRSNTQSLKDIQKVLGTKTSIDNYQIDLCDAQATQDFFAQHRGQIAAVIHFAALKSVPESQQNPLLYYQNNLQSLLEVLRAVRDFEVPHFVFSSSCSVYGNASDLPVRETTPLQRAESTYAYTKQIGERMVLDFVAQNPQIKAILLRYFNPAGAHPSGLMGEYPQAQAYNLVPILFETLRGIRPVFNIFGSDYPTRDGTCIRDYIHIMDLARAHTDCLRYLQSGEMRTSTEVFNVGIGLGVSVLEALGAFEQAVGQKLPVFYAPRRAGDVAAIYANYDKAAALLSWQPRYDIGAIMESAYRWDREQSSRT